MNQSGETILLVEDDEADVFIMKHVLKKAGIVNALQVVTHGQAALDYFTATSIYSDRTSFPLPVIGVIASTGITKPPKRTKVSTVNCDLEAKFSKSLEPIS